MSCFEGFKSDLRSIPELYQGCESVLDAASPEAERVSGTPSFGIKLNTAAVDARDMVRARLRAWSELVRTERGCGPSSPSVTAMAAFLRLHADWLCGHHAAVDAVAEMAETAAAARRVVNPSGVRKFRVSRCVVGDCEGELVATVQAGSDRLPGEVRCDASAEHVWSAYQWRELDRRASQRHEAGAAWLTPGEVAVLCQTSMSNVYRLASEKSWRRRTNGRRVLYAKADVLASVA
ncbi:helix-turn-helix domain-containing protein [Catellatospora tritici]|uniref:helix-turn-helix domain-containing protein n=1 Tax=Catellatospora tritici TaxID=2851566 RepID=UPI001C2D0D7E|nr:helix-turn-helix domain-containing protein [Catellatospora tritici]